MPAATFLMNPPRSSRRCEAISASAGSSRRVRANRELRCMATEDSVGGVAVPERSAAGAGSGLVHRPAPLPPEVGGAARTIESVGAEQGHLQTHARRRGISGDRRVIYPPLRSWAEVVRRV